MALYGRYGIDYAGFPSPTRGRVPPHSRRRGGMFLARTPGRPSARSDPSELTELLDALRTRRSGWRGVRYPKHSAEQIAFFSAYCQRHGLMMSAGGAIATATLAAVRWAKPACPAPFNWTACSHKPTNSRPGFPGRLFISAKSHARITASSAMAAARKHWS